MRGEFVLREVSAPRGTLSLIMSGFDELLPSNCTLGMMADGRSQHPNRFNQTSDPSRTFSEYFDAAWEEMEVECEEEDWRMVDLGRTLEEGRERNHEMFMSMLETTAAADAQTAMQDSRSAAREVAIREAEASRKRAKAEEEEAERESDISSSAADSRVTCEPRESVRGLVPAATRPRIPEEEMTSEKFTIRAILDTNAGRGEVLVNWDSRYSPTWETLHTIKPQVSAQGWKVFMNAKSRRLEQQEFKGFVGPYLSGTELGYATKAMVLSGDDPRRAAVGHLLWKVTGRRGIAKAM
jgi:hypothetical protein